MGVWLVKGVFVGAFVGCVLCSAAGWLLGGLMGSLASLPSVGSPDLIRSEAVRLAAYGALAGTVVGSAVGAIITAAGGNLSGTLIGTLAGAILMALYGAVLGSIRVNDNPVSPSRVLLLAVVGAAVGAAAGAVLGWVVNPVAERLLKFLQGRA